MPTNLSHPFALVFFLCIILGIGCWQKEYNHHQTHPFENDHSFHDHEGHDHSHDHSHDHNPEEHDFEEIVEELESKDRIIWQKPEKVLEMLGNLEGKTVADIGAGTGYFSFRMAHEAEKVIAVDIDPRFTKYIDSIKVQFPEVIQERIETRLADVDDPKINEGETDAIILVNTYSYIENRVKYFNNLKKSMNPGAKLLIVDYKKKRLPEGHGPPEEYRISADSVEHELEEAGYRLMETDDTTLDYQYIILVTNP